MSKFFASMTCAVALLGFAAAAHASPVNIDFAGNGGNLSTATTTIGGVGLHGYYTINDNTWNDANLFQRNNAPDDRGMGVCDPRDGRCTSGDDNEIDNNGSGSSKSRDLIRIDTGSLQVNSIFLSSLDDDGHDDAKIYGSNNANAFLTGTVIWTGDQYTGGINPEIVLTALQHFRYYFVTTAGGVDGNDDFLLRGLNVTTEVPEPMTLSLLGAGLLAGGMLRRRRQRA